MSDFKKEQITKEVVSKIQGLNNIAKQRGQSLASMALSWVLKDTRVTSALIGASKVSQLEDNLTILDAAEFSKEEIEQIDNILS